MNYNKWILENTSSLKGKTVAVTGTTGGIGRELCRYLAGLGANLILLDRNKERSQSFAKELKESFGADVRCITVDLEDVQSVEAATESLKTEPIDTFIHNAGAYKIPMRVCKSGYNNVFQINFLSPYYMIKELLPLLSARGGRVVAVSSIAHNYSKTDASDIDFSSRTASSYIYGNAKRYLTFSLIRLFENVKGADLSIVHPGISFTGITNHYPPLIFALIKEPMKVIFMKPKKACLSVLKGVFQNTEGFSWIGPRIFNIWGFPKIKRLRTCDESEADFIFDTAEKISRKG